MDLLNVIPNLFQALPGNVQKNVHAGCFFNLDRICRTRFEFLANSLVFALNVDEFGYGGKEAIKRAKLLGLTEYRKTIY